MFSRFLEWLASKDDARFRAYRVARVRFERYIGQLPVPQEQLSTDQRNEARHAPQMVEVESLYLQAIEMSDKAGAIVDVASGHFQLGRLFHLQGRFEEASESFQTALSIYDSLPVLGNDERQGAGDCHYFLGYLALHRGDVERARSEFKISLEVDLALGNLRGQAAGSQALALCDVQ